uniref:ParE toxin of type II toxin-antitoxin system, parDE n=1 Tax=Candidatus Kentrum sp. FW TaxID=2126338 RepID=A0A450THH5_9GAMM|nr:MAG: hypothetical protein BECKFW1821C_GA0114237_101030 [Candidatus Kentron sp. FW]
MKKYHVRLSSKAEESLYEIQDYITLSSSNVDFAHAFVVDLRLYIKRSIVFLPEPLFRLQGKHQESRLSKKHELPHLFRDKRGQCRSVCPGCGQCQPVYEIQGFGVISLVPNVLAGNAISEAPASCHRMIDHDHRSIRKWG